MIKQWLTSVHIKNGIAAMKFKTPFSTVGRVYFRRKETSFDTNIKYAKMI